MTIICFIHWPWLLFKYILLPIVQLLFESSVWSAFDGRHDIMKIGEGDHKLMFQWYYLVCTIDAHLNIYAVSQSMHSSEQNLFGILRLTLAMLFISFQHFVQLCCMELQRDITHTGVQICSAECPSFCLCNLCQLHSQIIIIIRLLWLCSLS